MSQILVIIFTLLLCFIAISIAYWTFLNGICPMPTTSKAKREILRILPNDLPFKKIYDLGSGWGNLVFMLADNYPNHQVIGYETSLIPYYLSKIILWIRKTPNLEIKRQDFYSINLSDAGLVVCYLFPNAMQKLTEKFNQELKPGAYVISHTFALSKWKPEIKIDIKDLYHTKIYLYKTGARS